VRVLTAALEGLYRLTEIVTNVFMVILFVVVNLGVFSRYIFQSPFIWTEELALFVLAWMVFLAGSLTIRRWENVRVTYFIEKLPGPACVAIELASKALVLAFLGFVLILSARIVPQIGPTETAPALNISMLLPQMGLVVGLVLMLVQMLGVLVEGLVALRAGRAS
jgi:TRAP-type C4-dicarboxylate transport system permease small subunit